MNVELLLLSKLPFKLLVNDFGDMAVISCAQLALQVPHEPDLIDEPL